MPKLKALKNSTAKSRKEKDIEKEATAFFLYSRVEDIEFMLSPKPKNFEDDVPNPNIRIAIQALPQPDVERNEFVLGIIISTEYVDDDNEEPVHLFDYHVSSTYKFQSHLKDLVIFKDGGKDKFDFPEPLMKSFMSTAYSTARGLLISKLSHSYMKHFILPMIPLPDLMEQAFGNYEKN